MRTRFMALGWAAALILTSSVGAENEQWVALVTAEHGSASFSAGSSHAEVHSLTRLPAGSEVQVDSGASVTVAFLKGGKRVTLTGPVKAQVGPDSVSTDQGKGMQETPIKEYQASLMPSGENLDRLGGISRRDGDSHPAPQIPTLAYLQSPPVLDLTTFSQAGPVKYYDVKVKNHENRRTVMEVDGKSARFTLSETEMAQHSRKPGSKPIVITEGDTYLVDITAYRDKGPQDGATYRIKVLPAQDRAQLDSSARTALASFTDNPGDVTPVALMGAFYEEHFSFQEAARKIQQLQGQHPEVNELQQVFQALNADIQLANTRAREAHAANLFEGAVQ